MKAPAPSAVKVTAAQIAIPIPVYAVAVREGIMLYISRGKMESIPVRATTVLVTIHLRSHPSNQYERF
ncbi:hypothetical protein E6H20_10150 [Candidatus Bathyarchaeota archaeon]|nr:MAG: hypothetical protein E6H20_10150 [Candidatus Bathyarchaeota archaeon]